MIPTAVIGGATQLLSAASPMLQKSSPSSAAESSAASAMYGSFSSGDFSVGGGSGLSLGGLIGNTNLNGLVLAGIGVAAIAIILVLWKKHK